jgi:PAS domain S-box-containing protein
VVEEAVSDVLHELDSLRKLISELEDHLPVKNSSQSLRAESEIRIDRIRDLITGDQRPAISQQPTIAASELASQIVDNIAEGVHLIRARDGQIVYTNPQFDEMFGYEQGELIGQHATVLNDNQDELSGERTAKILKSLQQCGHWKGEIHNRRKDGSDFWAHCKISTYEHAEYGTVRLLVEEDITERKLAEDAVQEKDNQLNNLLANVDAIILEGDPFNIYYVGGQVEKILGYPKSDWLNHPEGPVGFWSSILHPNDRDKIETCIRAIEAGEDHSFEYRMIAKNGELLWFYDSVMVETYNGKPVKTRAVMVDITERKRAENSLRDSEIQSRTLLEGSPVCNKIIDLDSKLQYMSAAGIKRLKICDIEHFYGHPYPPEFYPESIRAPLVEHLERAKAGVTSSVECPVLDTEGCEVWFHTTFVPARSDDGQIEYIIAASVDISDRKQTELALQKSRERFELAVSGTSDGLWDWDIITNEEYWSPQFYNLLGFTPAEIPPSFGTFVNLLHPDDQSRVHEAIRLHLEEDKPYDVDFRFLHKSGKNAWVNSRGEAVRNKDGQPIRMAGTIRDITERKLVEELLIESEQFLSQAETMAKIGHWRLNPATGEVTGSDELFRIFGLSREDVSLESFLDAVHPEDREYDMQHIQRGLDYGESWDIEHRLLHSDGTVSTVQAIGEATVDESGKTIMLMGTVQDITARK